LFFTLYGMKKEVWKDIPNYEGLYQVSNLGRVKSLKRWIDNKTNAGYFIEEKILKQGMSKNHYNIVALCRGGKCVTKKVHSLVAIAFLNHNPNGYKLLIDHIDNDKSNNKLENLQLITNRKNTIKDSINKTGYNGVTLIKNKYRAAIQINGKKKHIGYYKTSNEANQAYQLYVKKLEFL
jgi:hypothetical protein